MLRIGPVMTFRGLGLLPAIGHKSVLMKPRIMYMESKAEGLNGPARIGRVTFSKSGQTIYYRDQQFIKINGFKSNYLELGSGAEYWISGPRKDGGDRLYGGGVAVEIDEDVREEYWTRIRGRPWRRHDPRA